MVDFARPSSSTSELKVRGVPDSTISAEQGAGAFDGLAARLRRVAMRSASKFYNMEPLFRELRLL